MLHGILHGGADTIMGLGGDDLLFGDARTIGDGTAIGPVIFGGNDKLYGGSGNDHLVGGGGNDLLDGGAGTDTAGYNQQAFDANGNAAESGIAVVLVDGTASGYAHGAHGTDSLISIENVIGSFGNDILIGNSGANTLNGSAGNDSVSGKAGNDVLLGEAGNDQLSGGDGNDYLNGGAGDNRLFGEAGNDTLIESGAVAATFTVLDGGAGNDRLIGAATGTRTMNGGTGNDVIAIGGGDNWATTGTGIDTLQFRNFAAITSDAFAEVYDFTVNTDRIDLRALGITTATVDAKVEIGDWDTGAYVQVTNGGHTQTLLLDGVHAWELDKHSYDFILG